MNWVGNRYDQHDLARMQEDAIRRVREMQERARRAAQGIGASPLPDDREDTAETPDIPIEIPVSAPPPLFDEPDPPASPRPSRTHASSHNQGPGLSTLFGGLSSLLNGDHGRISKVIEGLGLDGEQLLILGLLFLLWNEQADYTLMLALLYLLF